MSKRNKIIYWIATIWLSLGMLSSGFVQIFQHQKEMEFIANLGYPGYFIVILGIWKILGVIAILVPKFPLQKEWAYAGFFFVMTGAAFSHIAAGTTNEILPSLLLLVLTVISYSFRPVDRKIISVNQ